MDKLCRVCSRSNHFLGFDLTMVSQITQERIDDMLVYCTQQEITEDGFPQQICAECFAALNSAFLFRKLTHQSAANFQEIASNVFTMSALESTVDQEVAIPSPAEVTIKEEHMATMEEELLEPSGNYPEETTDLPDSNDSSENETSLQPESGTTRRQKKTVMTYTCKECHYSTQIGHNFRRHQKTYNHSSFTQVCSKPIKRFSEVLPDASTVQMMQCIRTTIRKTKLYRCRVCGFQTFNQPNFRRHQTIKKHSSQVQYSRPFSESTLARLHKCPACGDLFASVAHLANHMKRAIGNNYQAASSDDVMYSVDDLGTNSNQEGEAEIELSIPKDTEIKQESQAEQSDPFGSS